MSWGATWSGPSSPRKAVKPLIDQYMVTKKAMQLPPVATICWAFILFEYSCVSYEAHTFFFPSARNSFWLHRAHCNCMMEWGHYKPLLPSYTSTAVQSWRDSSPVHVRPITSGACHLAPKCRDSCNPHNFAAGMNAQLQWLGCKA